MTDEPLTPSPSHAASGDQPLLAPGHTSQTQRVPIGSQTWQRVTTWVLLGLSVVGYGAFLLVPPTPLVFALAGPSAAAERFGIGTTSALIYVVIAWTLTILFVATWVITITLLRRGKLAFYVPLAAGIFASSIGSIGLLAPYLGL